MSKISKYQANARKLFALSLPIFIAQLSFSGIGLSDVIMAGLVNDDAVSAVAVGNSILFPLMLFCVGIFNAVTPTISYLNGAKQRHLVAHQIRQGYFLVICMTIPLVLIFLNGHYILEFMGTDKAFLDDAAGYLAVMAVGVFPSLLNTNFRCLNDGLSNTKPAMYIAFMGMLLNIVLNYIFIFGMFGAPALGAVGCAVATVIVNYAMVTTMIIYTHRTPRQKDIAIFSKIFEMPCRKTLGKFLRLGLPIAFSVFAEVVLFSSSSLFLSPLGSSVVASHQIGLQTSSVMFMLPLSFGIGVTIMVGRELGKGRATNAKRISIHALITALGFAVCTATIILLFRDKIPYVFTNNPESVAVASSLLIFAAIYQIPDAAQAIANGTLRGYKHTKPLLYTTFLCYWLIGIPFGFLLSRTDYIVPALGAKGFWIMFCISLMLSSSIFWYLLRRIQNLPKDVLFARLERNK